MNALTKRSKIGELLTMLYFDPGRNIYLKPKKAGGMKISFASQPKGLDEKMIYNVLRDYKMLNCEVLVRDENATVDELIDVIMANHRKYVRW